MPRRNPPRDWAAATQRWLLAGPHRNLPWIQQFVHRLQFATSDVDLRRMKRELEQYLAALASGQIPNDEASALEQALLDGSVTLTEHHESPERPTTVQRARATTAAEVSVDDAKRVLRRDYYESIRTMAKNLVDEVVEEGGTADEIRERFNDRLHENVDGSYWVIYTHAALQAVLASDRWEAIWEEDMEESLNTSDGSSLFTSMAYFAVSADVRETAEPLLEEALENADDEDEDEDDEDRDDE